MRCMHGTCNKVATIVESDNADKKYLCTKHYRVYKFPNNTVNTVERKRKRTR